jgi:hypothetical protein
VKLLVCFLPVRLWLRAFHCVFRALIRSEIADHVVVVDDPGAGCCRFSGKIVFGVILIIPAMRFLRYLSPAVR